MGMERKGEGEERREKRCLSSYPLSSLDPEANWNMYRLDQIWVASSCIYIEEITAVILNLWMC
jgi:hypothetical protein